MYIVFIILIFIASLLIILAVLAQNPKGGMAANFGISNQVMGARQTSSFLEKFTWGLALTLLLLSLAATMAMPKSKIAQSKSGIDRAIEKSVESNAFDQLKFPVGGDTKEATTETTQEAIGEEAEQPETPQE